VELHGIVYATGICPAWRVLNPAEVRSLLRLE